MATKKSKSIRVEYKNRTAVLEGERDHPGISIDGKSIDVHWDESCKRYGTPELPYTTYESLEALAQAVINYVPSFRRKK